MNPPTVGTPHPEMVQVVSSKSAPVSAMSMAFTNWFISTWPLSLMRPMSLMRRVGFHAGCWNQTQCLLHINNLNIQEEKVGGVYPWTWTQSVCGHTRAGGLLLVFARNCLSLKYCNIMLGKINMKFAHLRYP